MSRGCCATSGSAAKISSSTPYVLPNGESGSECEADLLKLQQPDVLTVLPTHRFAAAFALRQRMLNFVQNIQYYMMFEVMEPTWHIMENNLKTVSGSPAQFQSFRRSCELIFHRWRSVFVPPVPSLSSFFSGVEH